MTENTTHSMPYPADTFRGKPKHACIICGSVFIYPSQVERHYQRRHAEIIADREARKLCACPHAHKTIIGLTSGSALVKCLACDEVFE